MKTSVIFAFIGYVNLSFTFLFFRCQIEELNIIKIRSQSMTGCDVAPVTNFQQSASFVKTFFQLVEV